MTSLPARLRHTAAVRGEATALRCDGRQLSFAAIDSLSDRVAAGLAAAGIAKGDRVGLYAPNSEYFVLAYLGIVKAGACTVPVNVLLGAEEIGINLADAGIQGLLYWQGFGERVADLRGLVPSLELVVRIDADETPPPPSEISWRQLLDIDAPPPEVSFNPGRDLASILYTSGTTGRAKGAMLTHANLLANTASVAEALGLEPGRDRLLVVLPMFHSFAATVGMWMPLLYGLDIAILARFEPEAVARAIGAHRATVFLGVPSMYTLLARLPERFGTELASLRICISGGAALPLEVMERFEARFGVPIHEGDGPTECSPVTCLNPIGGVRKPGSVGLPVPGVEMQVLDETGRPLPDGEIGEVCVRGANVMKGYWQREEATREAFFDAWLRTGDLGCRDEDGYFFLIDRRKDLIIVNGMNVYPRMIEEVLMRFEPVLEAAVVGEPDRLHGEVPVAYLALEAGAEVDAAQVRAYCRERLGPHQVPRKVHIVEALPRNAAGKVLKGQLRKAGEWERGMAPE
jgi:long-chain acyl-CoA synthetase